MKVLIRLCAAHHVRRRWEPVMTFVLIGEVSQDGTTLEECEGLTLIVLDRSVNQHRDLGVGIDAAELLAAVDALVHRHRHHSEGHLEDQEGPQHRARGL